MENDFKNVIAAADRDAVTLKNDCDLSLSAQALQTMFDSTTNLPRGRRDFLVNSYVNELNTKADDLYGNGKHIKLEIIDTNKNMMLDATDKINVTHVDGTNGAFRLGNF
jgi:hypothetical protein